MCTSVPEVAVTVIGYVPAGVPRFEPTFGNPPPEQPLMYPAEISSSTNAPIGIKRRTDRRPSFAYASEISASARANAINHSGRIGPPGLLGVRIISDVPRAVVVTVSVVLAPGATEVGLNVPPAPVGNPLAVNVTLPANAPPTVAVLIVYVVEVPAGTVCVVGVGVTEKSVIVNVSAAVVPPPGVGVNTVTPAVPEDAMSAAVIAAVN